MTQRSSLLPGYAARAQVGGGGCRITPPIQLVCMPQPAALEQVKMLQMPRKRTMSRERMRPRSKKIRRSKAWIAMQNNNFNLF
eukprot:2263086-Rhodomonas_salina.1